MEPTAATAWQNMAKMLQILNFINKINYWLNTYVFKGKTLKKPLASLNYQTGLYTQSK